MKPLIYVMSPYSHKDEDVMNLRAHLTACVVAKLMGQPHYQQFTLFSPIIHYHAVAIRSHSLPRDVEFWWDINLTFMNTAIAGVLVKLPGWKKSTGVARELKWFMDNDKEVWRIACND